MTSPSLPRVLLSFAWFLCLLTSRDVAAGLRHIGRAVRRGLALGWAVMRRVWRQPMAPFLCAVLLWGCTAAQLRTAETVGLTLAEGACEAFLPMATPGYGALDVLGCKTAESLLAGAIGAAGPPPAPSGSILGGGGVAPRDVVHRKLKVRGETFAMVRDTPERVAVMQAWIDARTSNEATKATRP